MSRALVGSADSDFPDELVPHVHADADADADAELVAVTSLSGPLGLGEVEVIFPALGLAPFAGDVSLDELLFVFFGEVLDGRRHQRCIDDLPAPRQVAIA